ncbi:hypothetical protein GGI25_002246 [Coemansia spiralis]|uniref:RING-type E3 ubiquitin transferase n=2 Tax=Coemansia TaxID=4863 RepID=A0A9W8GB76_9FUNG|nr:hypothetical protein BX070DRAFT_221630 [Coemansia spiralis]KAJ1996256.1 hypothetical protein EDC05_000146 [Coemansia umbellata]KAJ2625987.1 hypothetical protein GGI26_000071 [Coemansia sp. RSA 1358]KAJ2678658.1 hypothetical protein GGI25_002246 [Coemansia spiralis]
MFTGDGAGLTDEQRPQGQEQEQEQQQQRQSQRRTPSFWCHQCRREISPMMAPNPVCPRCHGDFVEEIEAENDPRDFLASTDADNDHDEDEMENEFGGAGNYNQELQTMLQDMLSHIMGRPLNATGGNNQTGEQEGQDTEATNNEHSDIRLPGAMPGTNNGSGDNGTFGRSTTSGSSADQGERRFPGLRTWTSNLGGGHVSVSVSSFSPENLASRATAASGQRQSESTGDGSTDQQQRSSEDVRRPMFIDPEENAPLTLGNLVSSLMSALGGVSRGEDGQGNGGINPIFGVPIGNLGDYAWGQNSLDDIITHLMEQNQNVNSQPPASDEAIAKLPRRKITISEVERKLDCGICMDEYNPEEEVVELPCKHVYHNECIEHWLKMNGTCPICRTRIETKDSDSGGSGPGASGGSPVPRPHSDLPGSFPSSPQQNQSHSGDNALEPEQEPVD